MKLDKLYLEAAPAGVPSVPTPDAVPPAPPAAVPTPEMALPPAPVLEPVPEPVPGVEATQVPDPELEGQLTQVAFQLEGVATLLSKVKSHRLPEESQTRLLKIQGMVNELGDIIRELI